MEEKIGKILQLVEGMQARKNTIKNYEDAKNQVSVLLMNEVFGDSINEGMKVALLKVVSSILFDNNAKAFFSKAEHEWSTFCSISVNDSKILFDKAKNFVQITDAISGKLETKVNLYKCSNDIMTHTVFNGDEREITVYDDIGLEKNKIVRGISVPGNLPYEEHFTRDDDDLTTIFVNEILDNGKSFSTSVKKVSKIYELDTSANDVYHGSEDDLEGILVAVKDGIEKEEIYKYFPALKEKVLNRLSTQFAIQTESNKTM